MASPHYEIYPADDRGFADHGWLKSYHSFSFASYYNPDRIQFGALRVLNDDYVSGGNGFGSHPHDNMEIVSIPLEGALVHRDNMGTRSVIQKGEVQIMSAGTGVVHSEHNHHAHDPVRFLQIWVFPKIRDIEPRYEQRDFSQFTNNNAWQTVVSPDGSGNSLKINQDAYFFLGNFDAGSKTSYEPKPDNGLYVFLLEGAVQVDDHRLKRRDAIAIADAKTVKFSFAEKAELLLIEVPMEV